MPLHTLSHLVQAARPYSLEDSTQAVATLDLRTGRINAPHGLAFMRAVPPPPDAEVPSIRRIADLSRPRRTIAGPNSPPLMTPRWIAAAVRTALIAMILGLQRRPLFARPPPSLREHRRQASDRGPCPPPPTPRSRTPGPPAVLPARVRLQFTQPPPRRPSWRSFLVSPRDAARSHRELVRRQWTLYARRPRRGGPGQSAECHGNSRQPESWVKSRRQRRQVQR
jgi:hypothetical protein